MPCTIVNLAPFAIDDPYKPGLHPGKFPIGPSDNGKPEILVVKNCSRAQFNENFKQFDMPVPDEEVAESVVNDYIIGQQLTSAKERPALFWVKGEIAKADVEKLCAKEIKEAIEKQIAWFQTLVKQADDEWQRWHQHKFITDLQRAAARYLNYKREWLDDSTDRIVKCPACMTLVSKEAAVCYACHAILNEEKYNKIKFAGQTVQPVK